MTELGLTTDPRALIPGDAEGVDGVAAGWRGAGESAGVLSEAIFQVSPGDAWTGESAELFEARRTAAADAWAATRDALYAAADAVGVYAGVLRWAQQHAAEAIALWQEGQAATQEARAAHRERERAAGPTEIIPRFVDSGESARATARAVLASARVELALAGDTAAGQIRIARQVAPEQLLWSLMTTGGPVLVISASTPKAVADRLLLSVLARLSRADPEQIEELLELHPEWASLLERHPPEPAAVNAWWDSISDHAVQQALVTAAPAVLGALGGIPPLVRVAANRANAADRVDDIDDLLADPDNDDGKRAELEAERDYLQRAVNGDVQLYLYDPDSHSVIEIIGTPSDATTTVVTYVPGTFTTMGSFYAGDGGVQQVTSWLTSYDPGIVGFVWKEGAFPGEDVDRAPSYNLVEIPAMTGLLEANDPARADASGALLAGFQQEMLTSYESLTSAKQVAMGHSWGLTPITASEVAGAHYDQVHSLAGAGMPAAWEPDPSTSYSHWAYTDALTMAQETGAVWGGNIPSSEPAFTSRVYSREGDFDLALPVPAAPGTHGMAGSVPSIPATSSPVENHNMIASDHDDNRDALEDMLRRIQG